MSGIGDKIRNTVLDMVPGDAARKVSKALSGANNGALPSMNDHADQLHPVPSRQPLKKRPDGSLIFPLDGDYKP